jgi:hypothetical protein
LLGELIKSKAAKFYLCRLSFWLDYQLATEYNIDRDRLFEAFQIDDLPWFAQEFDAAMEYYRCLYTRVGETIRSYSSIEAFERAYLKSESTFIQQKT